MHYFISCGPCGPQCPFEQLWNCRLYTAGKGLPYKMLLCWPALFLVRPLIRWWNLLHWLGICLKVAHSTTLIWTIKDVGGWEAHIVLRCGCLHYIYLSVTSWHLLDSHRSTFSESPAGVDDRKCPPVVKLVSGQIMDETLVREFMNMYKEITMIGSHHHSLFSEIFACGPGHAHVATCQPYSFYTSWCDR